MFFIFLGAVTAAELNNVTSTEATDLMVESDALSTSDSQLSDVNQVSEEDSNNGQLASSDVKSSNGTTTKNNVTTKSNTKLVVDNARYSKSSTVFKVTLKDTNGNLLKNKKITLSVNGKSYKGTTQSSGAAYIATQSLKKGSYTVTAKFSGDSNYIKSSFSKKLSVYSSITTRSDLVKTCGVQKYYTPTFWKDTGRLNNTEVKYTLNGKTYTVKTDSKGVAKISTSLNAGKYTIKLYNPYSKETTSNTITVNKAKPKISGSDEYILPKTKSTYSIVLKTNTDKAFKNAKIFFKYNNKEVTALTNANGEASITIPALSKGTYTITYQFKGNKNYKSVSGTKKLYVRDSTTKLTASNLNMQYNDGSSFSVKATTSAGKVLANKTIKFTLNGKNTNIQTDNDGNAKLAIGALKPGTYNVKYSYSTAGLKDYNAQTKQVVISKQKVTITANDFVMKYNDGSVYQINVKNKTGANLNGVTVKFTLNGKTTNVTTDAKGNAKLSISEKIGTYPITIQIDTTDYSAKVTKNVLVNGSQFTASDIVIPASTSSTFEVKVLDGESKPVKATIKFTLNSKTQSVQTDANGIAKLTITGLTQGTYTVTYTDGKISGSSKITVVDKVTLKEIITASQNVKKYIESNEELPNTVKIGSATYSTTEYVYLASQAIINLKNNNKNDIVVKQVNDPSSPKSASNLGNLYDYLAVANSIVNTCNSKGTMPNSVSSKVGTIGYDGLVYATARVVAFYGDNSIMPNYVTIKTYESSSSSSLNTKNTITNLAAYLKSSTNCQVGNSKIKSIVNSLTSGLTSDKAKATAIYNYVRDYVSYSFYYDTKYGAVGTLNAKTGNCVDQAHLLVAMYRTAGLAARYAHGTCYFTLSGSTYGHVWTQVLIGDTWIVGDPTSSRNSFGKVVNWNNNNYNLKGYYASIAF